MSSKPNTPRNPAPPADSESTTPSPDMMSALRTYVRTKGAEFLKDTNISSIGIGYKMKGGKRTNEISIQFTVGAKAKPEALEALHTTAIPQSIEVAGFTVPTDVIQRKYLAEYKIIAEAMTNERKRRHDPVSPGISVSNANGTAGTIGCIVYDRADGRPYVLSNWHVLQGAEGAVGDTIVQPGPYDDNRVERNRLGVLVRSHLGHAGDCALATIEDRGFDAKVLDLHTAINKLGEPDLGDRVIKSGRTTGVTHGIVSRVHTIAKIDYGGTTGVQEIGGFEIGVDKANKPANGEVSMGGDSGSAWIFKGPDGKPNGVLAGLHFAGETDGDPDEHAVACYPKSVFEKLQIVLAPPAEIEVTAGLGYAPNFLGTRIDLPTLAAANKPKAFRLNNREVIDYTHFSLSLHRERRFPFYVAWNVDGSGLRSLSRKGIPFVVDPRIPSEFQAGDELYAGNRLDRGHIARRADLLWGPLAEAKKANKDSFFFTNITPQMDDFNQSSKGGIWGRLEDAVFAETDVENLRISVFGGPVFQRSDREFRGFRIPREFWKIIAFKENGKLKAKAFVLTQSLNQLEALELDEFRVFQVAVGEVETRTGIAFPTTLRSADAVGHGVQRRAEALELRKPLEGIGDIDWS